MSRSSPNATRLGSIVRRSWTAVRKPSARSPQNPDRPESDGTLLRNVMVVSSCPLRDRRNDSCASAIWRASVCARSSKPRAAATSAAVAARSTASAASNQSAEICAGWSAPVSRRSSTGRSPSRAPPGKPCSAATSRAPPQETASARRTMAARARTTRMCPPNDTSRRASPMAAPARATFHTSLSGRPSAQRAIEAPSKASPRSPAVAAGAPGPAAPALHPER